MINIYLKPIKIRYLMYEKEEGCIMVAEDKILCQESKKDEI